MSSPVLLPGAICCSHARMMEHDPLGDILNSAPPAVTAAESASLLHSHWGLAGQLDGLASERDLNWRVTTPEGLFVLKIANAAEDPEITRFQNLALQHIAQRDPGLPVPRVVPTRAGAGDVLLPTGSVIRLLTWLEGRPMHLAPRGPGLRRSMGATAARLTRALEGFSHPAADHVLQWDIKQASRLRPLLPAIGDPALRDLCARWLDLFDNRLAPLLQGLPWQVVHADLNPHNVLTDSVDHARIAGVLDFGDMVFTPRICDLAVAASYLVDQDNALESLDEIASAWADELPLLPAERDVLPGLTAIRMVTTIALASHRAQLYPGNAPYILRNLPSARAGLLALPQPDEAL